MAQVRAKTVQPRKRKQSTDAALANPAERPLKIERVDMESRPIEKLTAAANGRVKVALTPKQILTLRLT